MKWLGKVLRYGGELVQLGADVRELVDRGYPKRVLKTVVERLSSQDVHASTERMRIEQRINETDAEVRELKRRVAAHEVQA